MKRTSMKAFGRHRFGEANRRSRLAGCPQCRRPERLLSYDTQLWVVCCFVPVIPLGGKRVIDECPRCGHHTLLSLLEWNRQTRARLEEALRRMKEQPQDPDAAIALHQALLAAGQDAEATELRALLAQRFSAHPGVQTYLGSASEETAGRAETSPGKDQTDLPSGRRRRKAVLGASLVGVAILSAFLAGNHYLARHRTVHIVNGYEQPLTVRVDGARVEVPAKDRRPVVLPEGEHRAAVQGAVETQIDFIIPGSLRERWVGSRDYILNPGGAALLLQEETEYVTTNQAGRAPSFQLHFGQPFLALPRSDYLFAQFPEEIRLRSRQSKVRKRRLELVRTSPEQVFYALAGEGKFDPALRLAEWHLRRHPDAIDLLPAYAGVAVVASRTAQARVFLAEGAARRPVEVQWHRFYQEMQLAAGGYESLVREYDSLLSEAPEDSALLYLRGRLCPSRRKALSYYQRAIARDPQNPFAQHALGYSYAALGDWAAARPHFLSAAQLRPHDDQMQDWLFTTRLALGEQAALEEELQAAVDREPLHFGQTLRLCEVLVAGEKASRIQTVLEKHAAEAARRYPQEGPRLHTQLRAAVLYMQGAFVELEKLASQSDLPEAPLLRFQAMTELGRFGEALQLLSPDNTLFSEPFHLLAISLALQTAGLPQPAAQWRSQALARLRDGRPEHLQAVAFLESGRTVALEEALDLSLAPLEKAALMAALAHAHPDQAGPFRATARTLNVRRQFPYFLLNRLTQPD